MNISKRNIIKLITTNLGLMIILIATIMLFINAIKRKNNGIITLNEYSHAVVVCGESMTINHGHYNDPEIKELIDLAELKCSLLEGDAE